MNKVMQNSYEEMKSKNKLIIFGNKSKQNYIYLYKYIYIHIYIYIDR